VSRRLAEIVAHLKHSARPTLLIFDTFESAGEAERWVKESLLLALLRAPWLRIIIVGQRPIQAYGEAWARTSAPTVALSWPSPQEWFNYGQAYKPDLTPEFVSQFHAYANGKSAILAQVLGPGA
jgi:hypothetical protein